MAPAAALSRYADWFWMGAVPLWASQAADPDGGFFESLDHSGRPNSQLVRRVRVQWRQVHVFATLARQTGKAEFAPIARRGFEWAIERSAPNRGASGCAHLLSPDGSVIDERRDLYDQAFLLLATASLSRVDGDAAVLEVAKRVKAFLDDRLAAPGGGYLEDDRASLPRRQNPHMHLFEAFLALHAATGDDDWRAAADAIAALFADKFFDAETGLLRERFDADFRPLAGADGDDFEPGHMAEWVWLLERHDPAGAGPRQRRLLAGAERIGRDPRSGFLVNRATAWGKTDGRRRLWPQTEYLKALLVLARKGERDARARAEELADAMLATYLAGAGNGLWIDEFDANGQPLADAVPASILYHLLEAALETDAFLGEKGA